ncbi:acid phosphatase [Boletus coccyginus]|nr:acid phosphatase [Boletus coccyginus]
MLDAGLPLFLESDKIYYLLPDGPIAEDPTRDRDCGCFRLPKEVQQTWASHSPYFPFAEYTATLEHCEVVQPQRHGTRFPTTDNWEEIKKPLRKLLNTQLFKWDLGADELLLLGVRGAFDSVSEHYLRYKDLNGENQLPFVRASDSEHVVYSAVNWTQGSSAASGHIYSPRVSVIVRRANNTLGDFMCPNANGHTKPAKAWRDGFTPPIVERMNEVVPGVGLDDRDVAGLMLLCAFEALFHETPSPFCGLFTAEEWQAHKYHDDLLKFYNTRYGNPPGPVQGVGYVDGLLVRLAGQPVRDKTQTDQTLNASPVTFPLDCNLYAGFSHVDWIFAIYSAIAFFHPAEPPITDGLDLSRKWQISRRLPFSRRMIAEELRYSSGGMI